MPANSTVALAHHMQSHLPDSGRQAASLPLHDRSRQTIGQSWPTPHSPERQRGEAAGSGQAKVIIQSISLFF